MIRDDATELETDPQAGSGGARPAALPGGAAGRARPGARAVPGAGRQTDAGGGAPVRTGAGGRADARARAGAGAQPRAFTGGDAQAWTAARGGAGTQAVSGGDADTRLDARAVSGGGAGERAAPGERRWARIATVSWAGLIAVAFGAGALLRSAGALPVDPFAPLHAHPRFTVVPLLPAVAAGLAGTAALPAAAGRLAWRPLLALGWLGSAVWAVALALPDGLSRPLTAPTEYLAGLPAIGDHPLRWLRGFTRSMPAYPTHVKGHPPLPTLILWALDHAGLHGPGWAAALVIGAGTSATVAIALTVRALAGEDTARRAVPFLVLAPTALWVATSVDALFLCAGAWGVALLALAARGLPGTGARRGPGRRTGLPAVAAAVAGGLLLGALPYLSYGLLSFFALPVAVLAPARPARTVLVPAAVGFLAVPAAFTLAGFSWWDGVIGTHAAWAAGAGSQRPYAYFLVGDLAVLALLAGPATARALPPVLAGAASLVRRAPAAAGGAGPRRFASGHGDGGPRTEALGVLVAAALAGMVALDLSGVTRGEVERIWIPYAAWVVAANGVRRGRVRTMLFVQVVTALVIEALVRSPW